MLVLHGSWSTGSLAVWAEDAAAAAEVARRPGRRPTLPPHPFAAGAPPVRAALGVVDDVPGGEAPLLLPTRRGLPLPSPEVPALPDDAPSTAAVTGSRWRVPVLRLGAGPALLTTLLAPLRAEAVAGAAWRHLRELAAFADDLAARGRVLPVVVPGRGSASCRPQARWRPLMTRAGAAWARALTGAPPPVLA